MVTFHRTLIFAVLAAIALGLLAGCGNKEEEPVTPGASAGGEGGPGAEGNFKTPNTD